MAKHWLREPSTGVEVWLTASVLVNEAGEVYAIATTERARGVGDPAEGGAVTGEGERP